MIFILNEKDTDKLEAFMKENGIAFESYESAANAAIVAELKFQIQANREQGVSSENEKRLATIEGSLEHIAETMGQDNEYLFSEITDTVSSYISDILGGLSPAVEDAISNGATAL